jgi:glycosyltransferase involved in cell wall biosynthesis
MSLRAADTAAPVARTEETAVAPAQESLNLSIVIPTYNEEESIQELYARLLAVLEATDLSWEMIFVDDGSTDGSFFRLQQLRTKDERVRVIQFRRNFGKTAALIAGFEATRGAVVITMDADLQDEPSEIPRLLQKLDEGYDLVSGWKKVRHDPLSKTLPSRLFNRVVGLGTGIKLHDFNCGFKAYRREVVETVRLYGELHRFIPALAYWKGFGVTEIPVEHHARKYGRSKFGAGRLLKGLIDFMKVMFLTRYMSKPLHLFAPTGLFLFVVGAALLLALTFLKVFDGQSMFASHGPALLLGILLILMGVQLVSTGLLGEMIRNAAYDHREEFSVRERLG